MNKRPGHVKVTTETGYCSVCGRPRNLRREEHQLGNFVRTVVTCETCHRTLSSTMGVASAEAAPAVEGPDGQEQAAPERTPARRTEPASAARDQSSSSPSGPSGRLPDKRGGVKTTKTRAAKSK